MKGEALIVVWHWPVPAFGLRYHLRMHALDDHDSDRDLTASDGLDASADARRSTPTPAEAALEQILNQLGDGVLSGAFKREYRVGNWIVDFYFPAIRLAIEVDGGYHRAQSRWRKDLRKTADLTAQGITVLRLTNAQVCGDREVLLELLRDAWRRARLVPKSANLDRAGEGHYRAHEPIAFYSIPQAFAGRVLSPA